MITNNQFCYWDCKSFPDAMILLINCLVTFIILVISIAYCCQFYKVYKLQLKRSKAIYTKFLGIIIWAISTSIYILAFIFNVVYSLAVYYSYFDSKSDIQIGSNITFYSRFYAFLQTIPAMIVQTLLFTTAQTIITNSMGVLLENQHQPTKSQRWVYKAIRKYYIFRYTFIICWILVLIPFEDPIVYESITQIKITLLMIDCGIIIGLLRFCHRYMISNSQMLLPDRIKERNKLVFETKLLTICGICRLLMNLIFYIIFPIIFTKSTSIKPCIQEANDHLEFSIGYLGIGTYIMGHACIITIIKIYKPNNGRSSIIQSGSFVNFSDNNLESSK